MSSPLVPYEPLVWFDEDNPLRPPQPSDPYLDAETLNAKEELLSNLVGKVIELEEEPSSEGSTLFDRGEKFIAKTDTRSGVGVIAAFGDSTGAVAARWARRLMPTLAADNADAAVGYRVWNDSTQANNAREVIQAGNVPINPAGIKTQDNFNRVGSDLRGSTSSGGAIWGGSSGGIGNFTLDGSKAVRTSVAAGAPITIDSGSVGDRVIVLGGVTISTVGQAATQSFRLYAKYGSGTNNIYGYFNLSTAGIITWGIAKVVNGVSATMITGASAPIPSNTAGQVINIELSVVGTTVTFKLGSQAITSELTVEDATALMPITFDAMFGGPMDAFTIDSFTVTNPSEAVAGTTSPDLTIEMYNGSVSGSTLTYQESRLAQMCPVTPDLVFVNSCHNYGSDSPTTYLGKLDTFIDVVAGTWPGAGIVVMSQNPQKAPAGGAANHLARLQALPSYCAKKGIGYVPVIEAFRSRSDKGVGLVHTDGVHPTGNTDVADAPAGTAATNGAQLWTRVVYQYLAARRKATAPLTP